MLGPIPEWENVISVRCNLVSGSSREVPGVRKMIRTDRLDNMFRCIVTTKGNREHDVTVKDIMMKNSYGSELHSNMSSRWVFYGTYCKIVNDALLCSDSNDDVGSILGFKHGLS